MKTGLITLIANYIDDYGPKSSYELKDIVDMPVDLLTEYLFELESNDILKFDSETYKFGLGSNGHVFLTNSGNLVSETLDFDLDLSAPPPICSFDELDAFLHLRHVNPTCYHSFIVYGKKRIKAGTYVSPKQRVIDAPSYSLKLRQRWILDNILSYSILPRCVHGFVSGKSVYTNAFSHINQSEIGCVDIKDFFPSVTDAKVKKVFLSLGYGESIANYLTILTTYKSRLPQGAPTSPMLANLVMKPIDEKILEYVSKNNLIYTRYADDITISGDKDVEKHLLEVIKIIEEGGFEINRDKTHVMNDMTGKKVTGLTVNSTVKVPAKYKKKLRQEIYYCNKYGVSFHLKNSKNKEKRYVNYRGYLYGKAYYVNMVEPEVGRKFLSQLDGIFYS